MATATDYPSLVGVVQKFGDKPATETKEAGNQTVREFTVKAAGSQANVKVTLWPQFDHVPDAEEGDAFSANGKFTSSEGKTATFYNLAPGKHIVLNGTKYTAESDGETRSTGSSKAASTGGAPF